MTKEKLVSFAWRTKRKLPRWRQPIATASKRLALLVYKGGTAYWSRVSILNVFFFLPWDASEHCSLRRWRAASDIARSENERALEKRQTRPWTVLTSEYTGQFFDVDSVRHKCPRLVRELRCDQRHLSGPYNWHVFSLRTFFAFPAPAYT